MARIDLIKVSKTLRTSQLILAHIRRCSRISNMSRNG